MRVGELNSAKKLALLCLVAIAVLGYLQGKEKPVVLKGVVEAIAEENGQPKAFSLVTDGERVVVKYTPEFLMTHKPPVIEKYQEVEIKADHFKALTKGVTCEFLALVKAGAIRPDLAPKGDEPLPVDDLKPSIGYKSM